MVSWWASSAFFSHRFVSLKSYVYHCICFFMAPNCTCRDKRLNVSGELMQSVGAGDLFKTNIISFLHVISYQRFLLTPTASAMSTPLH